MKTLVTGAAGFIGSHLCEQLLNDGHEVTGVDNMSVGRHSNMAGFKRHERFKFYGADVGFDLDNLFEDIDQVYHLAARADIVPSIERPAEYHRSNVTGTINTLESCRKHGVKRIVYVASSSCYGIPILTPTPETSPIDCRYPYALTKYLGEQYAMHWAKVYGLNLTSCRLFNVYGPRGRTSGTYGAVLGVFLSQLARGLPLTVVGDGTQSRDFTFVTDVTRALTLVANSECSGEIFNIGSGGHYSVNKLVSLLGDVATVKIPKRPGEPDITFADISKIKRKLGWAPKVSFEEGVSIMLKHVRDFEDAPVWTPETIAGATASWFKHLGEK